MKSQNIAAWLAVSTVLVAQAAVAAPVTNHPAQVQLQQNMDTVLTVARNNSLNEQQKIRRAHFHERKREAGDAAGRPKGEQPRRRHEDDDVDEFRPQQARAARFLAAVAGPLASCQSPRVDARHRHGPRLSIDPIGSTFTISAPRRARWQALALRFSSSAPGMAQFSASD